MKLSILENHFLIDLAHEDLIKALKESSNLFSNGKILYSIIIDDSVSYFYKESDIYYSKLNNLWFSYSEHEGRYLYAFGLNEPKEDDSNIPACVFDFPKKGIEKNALGVFSRNSKGMIFILHRGAIQGISGELSLKFKEKMVEIDERNDKTNFILICGLNDPQLANKFSAFVYEIDKILKLKENDEKTKVEKINKNDTSTEELSSNLDPISVSNESCEEEILLLLKGLKGIKKNINMHLFTKKKLYDVMDHQLVDSYLQLLIKYKLVTELRPGSYLLKPEGEINKFKAKYDKITNNAEVSIKPDEKPDNTETSIKPDEKPNSTETSIIDKKLTNTEISIELDEKPNNTKTSIINEKPSNTEASIKSDEKANNTNASIDEKPKNAKICAICNHTLPYSKFYKSDYSKDGYSEKCKECSRKSYAATSLNELRKIVDLNSPFYKKDLLKLAENRTLYLDYIWTLQEFNLLEHDEKSDSYTFKPKKELDEFIEKYADSLVKKEFSNASKEKPTTKATKICELCGKSLPISKFYKSSTSSDGFSDKCKECSEKANAANILSEVQKFVKIKASFSKNELLENIENPAMIDSYIWTLQEHDLIEYQEKSNTYKINESKILNYMPFLPETVHKNEIEIGIASDEPIDTITIENEDVPVENEARGICKKEIIYISEKNGNSVRNLILKGIIKKEDVFTTIKGLQSIILDQNKILISKFNESLSDIMMELEINEESLDQVLKALENEKWESRIILDNNSAEIA